MMQGIAGRDYYNDLAKSQLVDLLAVSLQEQNLILTHLLEHATAATTVTPVSTARLSLSPKLNFTQTKFRLSVSCYVSERDFPTFNLGTQSNSNSTATTKSTKPSAASTPKKNSP